MARYATASDFFNGPLYTQYQKFPFFADRANWIVNRWPLVTNGTNKVAVLGCGPGGYLVEELVAHGVNCYGLDGYQKNANNGFVTIAPAPSIASRCILDADMSNNSDVSRLTTQEITVSVGLMNTKSSNVLHILTCNRDPNQPDPERNTSVGLNWLTHAAWRQLINAAGGTTHICLDAETWEVF